MFKLTKGKTAAVSVVTVLVVAGAIVTTLILRKKAKKAKAAQTDVAKAK